MAPSLKHLAAFGLCVATSFTSILSTAHAGESKPVLILVDGFSLKVSGRLEALSYEQAAVAYSPDDGKPQAYLSREQMATRAVINVPINMPSVPGMSAGQAVGAGLIGGLVAGAILESSMLDGRNMEIDGLRTALNSGILRNEVLATLDATVTEHGYAVVKKAVSPTVQRVGRPARQIADALGKVSADWVVLVASTGPIASVSRDNRRPVLTAKISLLRRQGNYDQFKAVSVHHFSYLGEPVPEGQQASTWWSANAGQRYLDQVRVGLHLMTAHAVDRANWNANEHASNRPGRDKNDYSLVIAKTVEGRAFVDAGDDFTLILPMPAAMNTVEPAGVDVKGRTDNTDDLDPSGSVQAESSQETSAPAEPAR